MGETDLRSRRDELGFTIVELLVVLVVIAIIATISMNAGYLAFDVSRLSATTANMRGIAEGLTRYQTDTNGLPGGGLQTVSQIAAMIRPSAGTIALKDGWSNDIYYQPVTVSGKPSFRLYSYGKDGASDGVWPGTWVDFYTDIVNEGGTFIQKKW